MIAADAAKKEWDRRVQDPSRARAEPGLVLHAAEAGGEEAVKPPCLGQMAGQGAQAAVRAQGEFPAGQIPGADGVGHETGWRRGGFLGGLQRADAIDQHAPGLSRRAAFSRIFPCAA